LRFSPQSFPMESDLDFGASSRNNQTEFQRRNFFEVQNNNVFRGVNF